MHSKLSDFTIAHDETLLAAASVIQANHARCCIVLNTQSKVVGVFSDGDILRALLDGVDTYTPLSKLVKGNFLYLKSNDIKKSFELIKSRLITLIPIVDDEFNLRSVITLSDILSQVELIEA